MGYSTRQAYSSPHVGQFIFDACSRRLFLIQELQRRKIRHSLYQERACHQDQNSTDFLREKIAPHLEPLPERHIEYSAYIGVFG